MGSLSLPDSGIIYVDTAPIIYTVERHADLITNDTDYRKLSSLPAVVLKELI